MNNVVTVRLEDEGLSELRSLVERMERAAERIELARTGTVTIDVGTFPASGADVGRAVRRALDAAARERPFVDGPAPEVDEDEFDPEARCGACGQHGPLPPGMQRCDRCGHVSREQCLCWTR